MVEKTTTESSRRDGDVARGNGQPEGLAADPQAVLLVSVILGAVFILAYLPTFRILVREWNAHEDYMHGYLVPPLAALMLWVRRRSFPGWGSGFAWPGLVLLAAAIAVRIAGSMWYIDALQGWSIILWVASVFWLIGGWKVFLWASPAVAFLWFMVPLPHFVQQGLRGELQRIVAAMSCWVLQLLGQPALVQGNTVALPSQPLEVAEACSGIRIFMGVFAFAFAYVILVRQSWWQRVLLVAAAIPVALVANVTRIVVLALLTEHVSPAFGKEAHEPMKLVMVVFAAVLLGAILFFLGRLFQEVEEADVGSLVRRDGI